jgi:regulator of sigma E protease
MNLLHLIETILAFSFMITIHEGGHYVAMRFCGVEVDEFAIGFGPTLFSRKWGRTVYAIRALPLGGFCLPKGGDMSGKSIEEMNAKPPEPGDFLFVSWWKRVIIALGGPLMNLVTALVVMTCLLLVQGEITPVEKPVIGFVPPGSLAEKAGLQNGDRLLKVNNVEVKNLYTALTDSMPDYGHSAVVEVDRKGKIFKSTLTRPAKPLSSWTSSDNLFLRLLASLDFGPPPPEEPILGINSIVSPVVLAAIGQPARNAGMEDNDEILSVNGQKVSDWNQLSYLVRSAQQDPIQIDFKRGQKIHHVAVNRIDTGDYKVIGIQPAEIENAKPGDEEVVKVSLIRAMGDSTLFCVNFSSTYMGGIYKLVTGKVALKSAVGGPVVILRLMYDRASHGLTELFNVVAVISLILFLMNLLPLPLVDGGQIVIFLIEGVKRSPVSIKVQMAFQQVGIVLIVGLFAFVIFNDFRGLFLEYHNHIH